MSGLDRVRVSQAVMDVLHALAMTDKQARVVLLQRVEGDCLVPGLMEALVCLAFGGVEFLDSGAT